MLDYDGVFRVISGVKERSKRSQMAGSRVVVVVVLVVVVVAAAPQDGCAGAANLLANSSFYKNR